eukprot:TRINITY_DN7144_c0_g1_i3.p1 TRINITY_DN7144_c0_g1~~TRINITY_DN7144_c0_g1_i3.p1  ORF type:complete len:515 (+),score=40.63 TRINITY_DN7144_c0_g1_i3:44-1546(+)
MILKIPTMHLTSTILCVLLSIIPTYSQIPTLNASFVYGQPNFTSTSNSITPTAIQIFSDHLWVADSKTNSIYSYPTNTGQNVPVGDFVVRLPSTPTSLKWILGQLWIGSTDCLYIYNTTSSNLTCIKSSEWGNVSSIEQSNVTSHVFIVDGCNHRVLELDIMNNFSIINSYFSAYYGNMAIQLSAPQSVVWCSTGLWISDSGQIFHFINNQTVDNVFGVFNRSSATSAYTTNYASALLITPNCRWLVIADGSRAMVFIPNADAKAAYFVFGYTDFISNQLNNTAPEPYNFGSISAFASTIGFRENSTLFVADSRFGRIISFESSKAFAQTLYTYPGNYFLPKSTTPQYLNLTIFTGNFSSSTGTTLVLASNQSMQIGGTANFAGQLQLNVTNLGATTNLTVAEYATNVETSFDSISVTDDSGGCYSSMASYSPKSLSVLVSPTACGDGDGSKLSKGAIAGIIIGSVFCCLILGFALVVGCILLTYFIRNRRKYVGVVNIE